MKRFLLFLLVVTLFGSAGYFGFVSSPPEPTLSEETGHPMDYFFIII